MVQLKLKNTIIYTVLGFLPLSFSLIFTPVYTQYLSKTDYGLLNLFTIISGILIPFFGLGIDQVAGFLYWDYSKDKKKLAEFMSTTICLLFLVALVIFLVGFLFGPMLINNFVKNGAHFTTWPYLTLALVYPFFMIINRVLLYYYRNEGDIKKYATLNISTLLLITTGSVLGVVTFNKGAEGAIEGRTIGFCGIILFFVFYELKKIGLTYNKDIAKPLIKMGGPLFLSTLIGALAYIGDRVIIEQSGTLEMLGIYGFSVTIASVIEILMAALSNSFTPGIYKTILEENKAEYKNTRFQLFILIYLIIALVVFITAIIVPFMKLFISPNFFEAVQYIPLLCLAFVPRVFTQLFSLKFYKLKKTSYMLYLNIAYLISIMGFGLVFYNFFGLKGVAFSVFVTGLINILSAYGVSIKLDSFNFNFGKVYLIFLLITFSILSIYIIPQTSQSQPIIYLIPLCVFIIASLIIARKECLMVKEYFTQSVQKFLKKESTN